MWSACHTSCMMYAEDTDKRCERWAKNGQCSNDPGYVLVNCPVSCGKSIGWSPWSRTAAGITKPLPYFDEFKETLDGCMKPVDLVGAAEMLSTQVIVFLNGGASMTSSLGTTAPNEYLGLFGITEAILYALVLYSFNIRLAIVRLSDVNDNQVFEAIADAEQRNNRLNEAFQEITNALNVEFSVDSLMTHLPKWQKSLHLASGDANIILQQYKRFVTMDTTISACPHPRGPYIHEIDTLLPNLKRYIE